MENLEHCRSIFEEITFLISLRQEGEYWDFKRQWYTKKTDMLHDIICMANNLCNRTAYIIIGIDEENDYLPMDVRNDPYRRNTQKIVDFLKDKKFAGGIRPVVKVENFPYHGKIIDVILVENSYHTPYYLTAQQEGVRANNIYTRIMDTNTPLDGSADINYVERLWRKRFHLDDAPIEKFCYYLDRPGDWEKLENNEIGYFYKYSPEYVVTCEVDTTTTGYEYYMFSQVDTTPNWWRVTLKYHQTAIAQFKGLNLDGGRSFVIAPDRANDFFYTDVSNFGYFIRGDLRFRLLEFYKNKETNEKYSYEQYMSTVVVFQSRNEYNLLFDYLQTHITEYHEIYNHLDCSKFPDFPKISGYNMDEIQKNYKDALTVQKILTKFRLQRQGVFTEERTNADT